jgi:hypothetical protein
MLERLRMALQRLWLRRRPDDDGESESHQGGFGQTRDQARFWAEFREGQREADARSSEPE